MDDERDTTRRVSRNDLVLKHVRCFSIQFLGELVDSSNFISRRRLNRLTEQPPDRLRYECRTVGRDLIDLLHQRLRKAYLYDHTSNGKRVPLRSATSRVGD